MDTLKKAVSRAIRFDDEDWKCPVCGAGYEGGRGFAVLESSCPGVDLMTMDDELFCPKCRTQMYGSDLVNALNEKMPNSAQTAEQVDKVYDLAMEFVNAAEAEHTCGTLLSELIDTAQNTEDVVVSDLAWGKVEQMGAAMSLHQDISTIYAERLADYCRSQKLV